MKKRVGWWCPKCHDLHNKKPTADNKKCFCQCALVWKDNLPRIVTPIKKQQIMKKWLPVYVDTKVKQQNSL